MRKRFCCFLFCIPFLVPLTAWNQYVQYNRYWSYKFPGIEYYGLKGAVQFIQTQNYKATGDTNQYTKGNKISSSQTYLNEFEFLSFDNTGRLIVEGYLFKNEPDTHLFYSYIDKNTIIAEGYPGSNSLNFQLKHNYSPKSLRLEIIESHLATSGINKKFVIHFSSDSTVQRIERFNVKDELVVLFKFKSNNNGNIIGWEEYAYGSNLMNSYKYTLNDKGLIVKDEWFQYNKLELTQNYIYDHFDNIIVKSLIGQESTNTFSFRYKYDHSGNWIERVMFINGIAEEICERSIAYF